MTPNDTKVLDALAERWSEYFGYIGFAALQSDTGLSRREVRLSCRRLTRKGFAEFARGLWSEDGMPAGSGYAATEAGRAARRRVKT